MTSRPIQSADDGFGIHEPDDEIKFCLVSVLFSRVEFGRRMATVRRLQSSAYLCGILKAFDIAAKPSPDNRLKL